MKITVVGAVTIIAIIIAGIVLLKYFSQVSSKSDRLRQPPQYD